jgi:hypothetical protein|tara:strand:- start:6 stop:233 length:228 start_codon:yes stop_codon:yes gene_type:complete
MARKFAKRYLKPTEFDPKGHWMVGFVWPVKGSKDNDYSVELHDNGFDCDCTGFAFHGRCKHSKAIVAKVERQMVL